MTGTHVNLPLRLSDGSRVLGPDLPYKSSSDKVSTVSEEGAALMTPRHEMFVARRTVMTTLKLLLLLLLMEMEKLIMQIILSHRGVIIGSTGELLLSLLSVGNSSPS